MSARFPALLSYAWRRTYGTKDELGVLLRLEQYGFQRKQVIRLCARFATVLGYAWQRTHGLLLRLEGSGFTRAQVIALCEQCPILLGCRWERTEALLRFAARHDISPCPQLFLFAPAKIDWRWQFLTGPQKRSAMQARAALFLRHKEFVQRFGEDHAL